MRGLKKVLVAEDEGSIREFITLNLAKAGYNVSEAKNGAEAMELFDREKDSFDIHIEYIATPSLDGKTLILVDPMLATGASMELAYRALLTKGTPERVIFASVIASAQAVEFLGSHFSDNVSLYVACIDDVINEHKYIVPGLGDAGDLAYGAKDS